MTDHSFSLSFFRTAQRDDSDLFKFLHNAAKHEYLDAGEERKLIAKAQKGGKRGLAAIHMLCSKNMKLMLMMANRFRYAGAKFGFSLSDLFSEAYLGFQKAIEVYDLDHPKKVRLTTYSVWWMRSFIGRAIQDKGRTIRIPVHISDAWQKIDKAARRFVNKHGREPTDQELAVLTGEKATKIGKVKEALQLEPASLDDPQPETDFKLIDIVQDPSKEDQDVVDRLEAEDTARIVRESVGVLSDLEKTVIRCRIDDDLTLDATAAVIRPLVRGQRLLSRERVRQVQTRALDKLRREILKAG